MVLLVFITGCDSNETNTDVEKYGSWEKVSVYYTDIQLNWEQNYFVHNGVEINIPEDWFGDEKKDFDDLNKHDLTYEYKIRENVLKNGEKVVEAKFADLDHSSPKESIENFSIKTLSLDIDSKILTQDEFANDYYFKYDFNEDYNNYCYFKISKNDINQLKSGSFNEIKLSLRTFEHIDNTKSFQVKEEDGIPNVGYYSKVKIYSNPDIK